MPSRAKSIARRRSEESGWARREYRLALKGEVDRQEAKRSWNGEREHAGTLDRGTHMSGERKFSERALKEIESVLAGYPARTSAILPLLHLAQREFGFIDNEIVEFVADLAGVKPIHVEEALGFYTMFHRTQSGKYVIQICTNISCSLLGSEEILTHLEKRLGIARGSTTSDGLVTLKTVECLGSCGTAPVMMVNDTYHENLSIEKVETILNGIGV